MNTLDRIINKNQDVPEKKNASQQTAQTGQQVQAEAGAQPTGQTAATDIIGQQRRNKAMDDANRKLASSAGAVLRNEKNTLNQPTAQPSQPTPTPYVSMEEIFKATHPQPTPEELEAERKKEKREKLFSAISDGISSMANLYFTTKYAPNMFNPNRGASKRTNERWEKLAAQRNANMRAYLDGLMKAKAYDDNHNDNERKWQRQLTIDAEERKRKDAEGKRKDADEKRRQAKEKRDADLHTYAVRKAESDAQTAETEAKYAEQKARSEIARNNRTGRGSSATGTRAAKAENHKHAMKYWASLSDKDKNTYRDIFRRKRTVRTGSEEGNNGTHNATYGPQYMADDDDFIDAVFDYRKAYLENNGRGDEIATGAYNKRSIAGFGKSNGKQKLPGFGGN